MKRWLSHIIIFIVGIIFGIALCMALAFYSIHKEMGKALIGPRIFGDIRILPGKMPTGEKTLSLQKDQVCFVIAIQDSNGATISVSMLNKTGQNVAMLQPLQNPGDWWCSYGGSLAGEKITGEVLLDLNIDGQFDTKYFIDKEEKKVCWIFLDGDWHKAIGANRWRARDDSTMFRFDPNAGWQQDDVNLPDKQKDL